MFERMGHRFFHPDQLLEPLGAGWVMVENEIVLGAVVPLGGGSFGAFVKSDGKAVPVRARSGNRAGAAVVLWNASHAVRWGDRG